ncbi:MAG: AAA family ATPase [Candidatus Omnitrophica bacterium]|nr:AAA family ATPase [Candidatus Paceibacterota bacterium]MCK5580739.1 AAA family ATPase [Candidatus Omnitrophota bacterium]
MAAVKDVDFSPVKETFIEEIEITDEYKEIFEWIKAGAPIVFVTGKAGTGKTTFVRYLRQVYDGNIVVVAPTGVAALNIDGVTINSFFQLPWRLIEEDDIKFVRDRRLITKMKVLIIDEISMVRSDIIDAIDKFLRLNRESDEPFGGVQLLLIGDLFQLPPVLNKQEAQAIQLKGYDSSYFFSAKVLKECSLVPKELTKIYRQSDRKFIDLLNNIRIGENLDQVLPVINCRVLNKKVLNDTRLTLSCTNYVADKINESQMRKLPGELRKFEGMISGKFIVSNEKLPSPINLALKKGAQVMFTKNDGGRRWVNGTLGRIVGFERDSIRVDVEGEYQNKIYDIQKVTWESYKYKYDEQKQRIIPVKVGFYTQYPLMLAWAVTIHKGQGKTLEKVHIDLGSGAFGTGQVYVALSRCRSLEDIQLAKFIRTQDIKCDPIVKRFYKALQVE